MLYSGQSFCGSALHHVQAHANSRPHSKYAPWAGDKGLGRNGIPKPAGAGGGSSSSSLAPDAGPTRLNNLEITPRRAARRCQPSAIPSAAGRDLVEQNERP